MCVFKSTVRVATALATLLVLSRAAKALSCGETITTDVVMTADLVCATNPALTIDGGSLDMHGFKLTCVNALDVGIDLIGSGATVRNGGVYACNPAVRAGGTGGHKIERIYASNCNYAFYGLMGSLNNKWLSNVANHTTISGFALNDGGNKIIGNAALDSGFDGFSVGGTTASKILDNVSANAANSGIVADGVGSDIKGNSMSLSGAAGMVVSARGKIKDNVITTSTGSGLIQVNGTTMTKNVIFGNTGTGVVFSTMGVVEAVENVVAINGTGLGDHGIDVQTSGGVILEDNLVVGSTGRGISMLAGIGNSIVGNTVLKHGSQGLLLGATLSTIAENIFIGSPTDTTDLSVNCGTNVWSGNIIGINTNACELN